MVIIVQYVILTRDIYLYCSEKKKTQLGLPEYWLFSVLSNGYFLNSLLGSWKNSHIEFPDSLKVKDVQFATTSDDEKHMRKQLLGICTVGKMTSGAE